MEYVVETENIAKSFKKKKVVDSVNMHIKKGEIYGLVGPNGAGKSTVLKLLLYLVEPDNGTVKIFGKNMSKKNYKALSDIGCIIEYPYFYDKLTGKENLELHCAYMRKKYSKSINEVLELEQPVGHYSVGMRQRLAIARAVITNPKLLILDEPLNGLDPEGIVEIRTLLMKLKVQQGMSILVSSHILSELELITDMIGVIRNG